MVISMLLCRNLLSFGLKRHICATQFEALDAILPTSIRAEPAGRVDIGTFKRFDIAPANRTIEIKSVEMLHEAIAGNIVAKVIIPGDAAIETIQEFPSFTARDSDMRQTVAAFKFKSESAGISAVTSNMFSDQGLGDGGSRRNFHQNPKIYFAMGSNHFEELVLNADVFVDKSLLIKEFLEADSKVILITRPRRWGKTLNMSMLEKFFEIEVDKNGVELQPEKKRNRKLFEVGEIEFENKSKHLKRLNIAYDSESMEHQGKFPVISINLKRISTVSYESFLRSISKLLKALYKKHYYLLKSERIGPYNKKTFETYLNRTADEVDFQNGLEFLSSLLYDHFKKESIILIDEYDYPINDLVASVENPVKSEFYQLTIRFFRNFFGIALKDNSILRKGFLTGLFPMARSAFGSSFNNVKQFHLLQNKFAKHYGFSEREVKELCKKVPKVNFSDVKAWYNGYDHGGERVYNPWSIISCLEADGKLQPYWIESGGVQLIQNAILSGTELKQENVTALMTGKSITRSVNIDIAYDNFNTISGLLSLMLFAGYLNGTEDGRAPYNVYHLSIPNKEINQIFEERVKEWLQTALGGDEYFKALNLFKDSEVKKFLEFIKCSFTHTSSYHLVGPKKQHTYHMFLHGVVISMLEEYYVLLEEESDNGRADCILTPRSSERDRAFIFELKAKYDQKGDTKTVIEDEKKLKDFAKEAIDQIVIKKYNTILRGNKHVKYITRIGMALSGKYMQYEINEVENMYV